MRAVAAWYLVVQLLGVAAYRLTASWTAGLPDHGYGASKTLGVFTCGVVFWLGAAAGVLPHDSVGASISAGALIVMALACRAPLPARPVLLTTEITFAAAFGGWCLLRAAAPDVSHTEQPMDLMLLGAMAETRTFPPEDPWLAGYPVSYYYLGYWLQHTVARLAWVPVSEAYNIAQACWFALLVTGSAAVGVALRTEADAPPRRTSLVAGLLTAVAVVGVSSLQPVVEAIGAMIGGRSSAVPLLDRWPAARAVHDLSIDGAPIPLITEFPAFSYLLGDNHPHLLAMPFVVALVLVAIACVRARTANPQPWAWLCALAGALAALNTWDLASASLVVAATLAAAPPESLPSARRLAFTAGTCVVALVPYAATAQSQAQGVLPNLLHPTPAGAYLEMFGAPLAGAALLVVAAWWEAPPRGRAVALWCLTLAVASVVWLAGAITWVATTPAGTAWWQLEAGGRADVLDVVVSRWSTGWPVLVGGVIGVVVTLALAAERRRRAGVVDGITIALGLAAVGLTLASLPELAYVRDAFGTRMNTVFKFYYQAWLFLSVAGIAGVWLAWGRHGGWRVAAAVTASLTVGAGLVYPVVMLAADLRSAAGRPLTLDALAYVERSQPDLAAAIAWIRSHTRPGTRVVQAPGDSYHVDHALISTATGRPTLLGWEGHERQWRGGAFDDMVAGRVDALERIYRPRSATDLREVLSHWSIEVVCVGPAERARYALSAGDEAVIARVMDLVFDRGTVRLYRRRA